MPEMSPLVGGIVLAILSSITYGASAIFARLGLEYFKPLSSAVISLWASVALAFLVVIVFEPRWLFSVSLAAALWFALVGLVHFAGGRYFSYLGVSYIGASRGAAYRAASPLFSMTLAVVFLKEVLTARILIGTIFIMVGLYLLLAKE